MDRIPPSLDHLTSTLASLPQLKDDYKGIGLYPDTILLEVWEKTEGGGLQWNKIQIGAFRATGYLLGYLCDIYVSRAGRYYVMDILRENNLWFTMNSMLFLEVERLYYEIDALVQLPMKVVEILDFLQAFGRCHAPATTNEETPRGKVMVGGKANVKGTFNLKTARQGTKANGSAFVATYGPLLPLASPLHFDQETIGGTYGSYGSSIPTWIYPRNLFSFSCWLRLDADHVSGWSNILSSDGSGLVFGLDPSDKFYMWNTEMSTWWSFDTPLSREAWHHLAATYDAKPVVTYNDDEDPDHNYPIITYNGLTSTIYVDGVAKTGEFQPFNDEYLIYERMVIGFSQSTGNVFQGNIRQIVWSESCWTPGEVAMVYNGNKGVNSLYLLLPTNHQWLCEEQSGTLVRDTNTTQFFNLTLIPGMTWELI